MQLPNEKTFIAKGAIMEDYYSQAHAEFLVVKA